jgi:hypothetical protein
MAAAKWGPETVVNTTTNLDQLTPTIVTLADGGFLIAWTDNSLAGTGEIEVRAQRYDSAGNRVGDELLVTSNFTEGEDEPNLVAISNGGFAVMFRDVQAGAAHDIDGKVYNAAGAMVNNLNVARNTAADEDDPDSVQVGSNFVTAFQDATAGDIKAAINSITGIAATSTFTVNTTTAGVQDLPDVTVLTGGRFVITWSTVNLEVRARLFEANGTPVAADFQVGTLSSSPTTNGRPHVSPLSNGGFVVAYSTAGLPAPETGFGLVARIFDSNGTAAGPAFEINTTTAGDQRRHEMTAMPNGGFAVVWEDGSSGNFDIRGQVFDNLGNRVGNEFLVNTTTAVNQAWPVVAALADGRLAIAWEDPSATGADTSGSAIRLQIIADAPVITSNGGGDTAALSVSENSTVVTTVHATDLDSPTLAYSLAGGADQARFQINPTSGVLSFIAAPDFENPGDADHNNSYIVQVRASDGSLFDTQTITVNVTDNLQEDVNSAPSADFDGNGRSDLLWRNDAGEIAVWQTNSAGVLASAIALGSAPASFHIDAAGDFNHDSRGDILFRGNDGSLAVWQTNGQQIQSITALGSAPPEWHSSGIGDFNGDGTSDLLFRNVDGQIAQWIINNNQIQSIQVLGSTSSAFHVVAISDFNGDGKSDLLFRDNAGVLATWILNGNQLQSIQVLGSTGTDWHLVGTGDFNGDGKIDLLWHNDNGQSPSG